ncbi:tryptophan synthase subunit alpha [Alcaligenaceae bacterium]|nr:tryptophan synthase subunit alpha [Alcaligenaceae bacterium]
MTSSNARLAAAFEKTRGATALIPYITAGDPSIDAMPALMHALVKAGADVIELGVPFSDPMADGPVIQQAAERAIKRGVGLQQVFEMVAKFRQNDQTTPVVLMGYANPIERMGQAVFAQRASQAGVDGLLVVDYPPEEMTEFSGMLDQAGIDPIFLLAPTSTPERMQKVAQVARGYVYYVSLKGVTGSAAIDTADVSKRLDLIRQYVTIPVGVGFGIRDAESASRLAQCADAIVIGSKLIETMENAVATAMQAGSDQQAADALAIQAAADWLSNIHTALGQ